VAREVFKAEDVVDYTPQPDFAEKFARRFGASAGAAMAAAGWIDPRSVLSGDAITHRLPVR